MTLLLKNKQTSKKHNVFLLVFPCFLGPLWFKSNPSLQSYHSTACLLLSMPATLSSFLCLKHVRLVAVLMLYLEVFASLHFLSIMIRLKHHYRWFFFSLYLLFLPPSLSVIAHGKASCTGTSIDPMTWWHIMK